MLKKVEKCFAEKLPFVMYAKPNSVEVNGVFQKNTALHYLEDFSQNGFVFAPFDDSEKSVLIPFDKLDSMQEQWNESPSFENKFSDNSYSESEKIHFEELVKKMVSEIEKGQISKIVASRREDFLPDNRNVLELFQKMFYKYPTAFRYCFYHPKVGLWLGATPEKLLSVSGNKLQTMAYAGTQKFEGKTDVIWQEKEKQEQQFVTDFIVENLKSESEKIELSEPFTSQAGALLHIRTDIKARLKHGFSLKKIIGKLHPTPAVCGFPKDLAKEFILKNEGYDRSFYSGFLGELNINNVTELYVNLRCMEIQDKKVRFYIGCG
ncbi:MAG: chorismate-binding protein, partial [Flavobacteriaceae bacterium]